MCLCNEILMEVDNYLLVSGNNECFMSVDCSQDLYQNWIAVDNVLFTAALKGD